MSDFGTPNYGGAKREFKKKFDWKLHPGEQTYRIIPPRGILKESGELERAKELGASIVNIKHLHDGVINKIDASSSSFWAAKNSDDKATTKLGLMDRQRVKIWLRDAYLETDAS